MLGALKLSAQPSTARKLTRFAINVETRAEAQAIQTFLWCVWLSALHQTQLADLDAGTCNNTYSGASTAGPTNATSKTTTYDQYSRPVATSTVIAGQTFVSQVAYDGRGRPLYSVYPQATLAAAPLSLKQSYNSYGFASQTEHATTGFVYSTINSRNNDGQVNGATMGGGLLAQSNGYSGDGLGRIASINITGGTALTQSFGFESVGNLKARSLTGGGRTEVENFTYDTLDRLLSSGAGVGNVTALPDTGSFGYDSAGNLNSKVGLTLGYAANSSTSNNRLCGIAVVSASTCSGGTGAVSYDGNGNITGYTRPTQAQSSNAPGADGATLALNGYTAFNLPTSISKSLAGTVQASAEFFYDAGYQRVRQVKRGPAGAFADDILYVVPGGFEVHRNAAGQIISSIATVSGPDGVVATVSTQFDPNTGLPVTQASVTNLSGSTTVTKLLLKDHLGSMVAEFTLTASNAGTLVVHGFGPWGNARNGLNGDQRGFTGHEHLAELGIIHMNGRLYDAVLGRFLQADPIIQAPHNVQSHNRYSYVLNNPLSFTDPSGFSAWTQWRSTVFAIVAAVTMQYYLMPYLLGASSFAALSTGGKFIAVVASGFASGGIAGGNIQSALQGAFVAGLTFGLATEFGLHEGAKFLDGKHLGQMALHSAMGCAQSAAAGGSCKSGAVSGGVSAFASPLLPGDGKSFSAGRLIGNAIIGAVAARLSGGKAENGALTAAFSYLFNEAAVEKGTGSTSEFVRRGQTQYPVTYDYENAKIIIMDPNDGEFAEAYARKGTPGQLLIISHGHERMAGGMFPPQMDAFIRASGMWKAGMDVVHDACNVGRLDAGFARAMAESLGVNYTAPTRYSWSAWGIWGTTNGGNIPDFTDPGRMRTFSPLNPRQRN